MRRGTKIMSIAAAMLLTAGLGAAGTAWATGGDPSGAGSTGGGTKSVKLLGSGTSETKFVPITPCRIVDTRLAGGKLTVAGGSRVFDVAGSGATFAAQGGKAGGCGIPTSATAIEATITAIDSGSGFLRAWPANAAAPNATFLNYTDMLNVSNTGAIGINGCTGICLVNTDLRLRAFGSDTHVVVDVNGYYNLPMSATVSESGVLGRRSRATSATHTATGRYSVVFDRNISSCNMIGSIGDDSPSGVTIGEIQVQLNAVNDNAVFVATTNSAGADADRPFMIEVIC